jgi:hypothetical protein
LATHLSSQWSIKVVVQKDSILNVYFFARLDLAAQKKWPKKDPFKESIFFNHKI